jgi:hypothetical protein
MGGEEKVEKVKQFLRDIAYGPGEWSREEAGFVIGGIVGSNRPMFYDLVCTGDYSLYGFSFVHVVRRAIVDIKDPELVSLLLMHHVAALRSKYCSRYCVYIEMVNTVEIFNVIIDDVKRVCEEADVCHMVKSLFYRGKCDDWKLCRIMNELKPRIVSYGLFDYGATSYVMFAERRKKTVGLFIVISELRDQKLQVDKRYLLAFLIPKPTLNALFPILCQN